MTIDARLDRIVAAQPAAVRLIEEYLDTAGHRPDSAGALFQPVKNPAGDLEKPLSGKAIHLAIVKKWAAEAGIPSDAVRPHALRTTAATNALEHGADIAKVQEWPFEHFHHVPLRQAQDPPGGFANFQC